MKIGDKEIEINVKRFIVIIFIIILLWASFFWFAVKYGEKVTRDPCSLCASNQGKQVICSISESGKQKIFYPDGSSEETGNSLGGWEMNKKGGIFKYIFWMAVGIVVGLVLGGKLVCTYWCGCN